MRVLLVDDHELFRDGLRTLLQEADVQVVGDAGDGWEAVAKARELRPDVIVMDLAMPGLDGVEATRRLVAELPGAKVVALSADASPRSIKAVVDAGAAGYLLKDASSEELVAVLRMVADGRTYLSPGVARRGPHGTPVGGASGSADRLTPREREVLQLVAAGRSSKEIATALRIAVSTVEMHRRQLMAKLELRSIAELTKYAIREGLTSVDG